MTTTNPNPLDRIRSLAPADMTDDELGVAVLLEIGCKYVATRQFEDAGFVGRLSRSPGHSFYPPLLHGPEYSPVWQDANPAECYDALLPIVREWAFADAGPYPERIVSILNNLEQIGRDGRTPHVSPTYRSEYFPQYRGLWLMLVSDTRQLAEAFVTAARSVQ